jgi:uncharacterized membrane protein YGL010W
MHQWLDEYGDSHRHPTNKAIHWICVPAILFSVLGLLWLIPVPDIAAISPWANWATLLMALTTIYYLILAPALAGGMALLAVVMFGIIYQLDVALTFPLWRLFAGIFIVAWIGQFIGHEIEGKKPSFFKDLQFLLIGPAWLMADLYRRLGIEPVSSTPGRSTR